METLVCAEKLKGEMNKVKKFREDLHELKTNISNFAFVFHSYKLNDVKIRLAQRVAGLNDQRRQLYIKIAEVLFNTFICYCLI